MPRSIIQNRNASLYHNGAGSVTINRNATTDTIGDATHTVYSWGCRVKLTGKMPINSFFFTKSASNYSFSTRTIAGGLIRFAIYDGTNNPAITTSNSYCDDKWHTFVAVRNGNTLYAYVDGIKQYSTSLTGLGNVDNTANISINGNTAVMFNADSWFTFNALSDQEVKDYHYTNNISYSCLFRLPFNDGSGTTAYDISGNGNNGTLAAGTWTNDVPFKKRYTIGDNLVYNGDFEYVPQTNVAQTTGGNWIDGTSTGSANNYLFGWFPYNYTSSYACKFDTTVSHSGKASMKISTTGTASTIGLRVNTTANYKYNNIPVTPYNIYSYSFWVKTQVTSGTATTGFRILLTTQTGSGNDSVSTTVVTGLKTTQDWTQYTGFITANSSAQYITPVLQIIGNDGTGTLIMDAWIDDIEIRDTNVQARRTLQNYSSSLVFTPGSGSQVAIASATGLSTKTSNLSLGGWFKLTSKTSAGSYPAIFQLYGGVGGAGGTGLQIYIVDDTGRGRNIAFKSTLGGASADLVAIVRESNATAESNKWVHFAITYDGTTIRGYLNGRLNSTNTSFSGAIPSVDNSIYIGRTPAGGAYWNGNLQQMFVGPCLTDQEIFKIYSQGIFPSGMVGIWPLDDGVTTARDISGSGNHGTISSVTTSFDTPFKKRTNINDNLVYNGDFEYAPPFTAAQTTTSAWLDGTSTGSSTNNIFGWAIPTSGLTSSANVSFDSTVSYRGEKSLKLSTLNATGTAVVAQTLSAGTPSLIDTVNLKSVLPNTSYTLTAWVKTNNVVTNSVYIDIREYAGDRSTITTTSSSKLSGTNDWTNLRVTVTTSSTTRYIGVILRNAIAGNISDAWFDDIVLKPTTATNRTSIT